VSTHPEAGGVDIPTLAELCRAAAEAVAAAIVDAVVHAAPGHDLGTYRELLADTH